MMISFAFVLTYFCQAFLMPKRNKNPYYDMAHKCGEYELQTVSGLGIFWWRCGELNPGPKKVPQ